ncbi:MAG: DUF2157 domain-containing protein [Chloroflexota bacterium]|nr:DUF2157 domain-containing protein [Chloroflexota bacterium]MDE2961049.1 DUF2157 domain-containing protein [Chloroflexota bacterium]
MRDRDDFPRRLPAEVAQWQADGLISQEQAGAILERYGLPTEDELPDEPAATASIGSGDFTEDLAEQGALVNRAVSIIGVMGALLVGLGIIIYVAANWDVIPVWARVTMLVGLTAVVNAGGWALLARFDYPRAGVAMLVVGALAYGAAIHLIAQIYHVPVNHPNLTTVWFLGVLPMGYIARSRLMVALSLALLVLSMGFRTQWWLGYYGEETILFLAPLTLALSAAVVSLGLLQLRFAWTRPLAAYCYYPGLAIGSVAFCVMTLASIWTDAGKLAWEVVSPEYWITAGVAIATAAAATAGLWWPSGGQRDGRPLAQTALVAAMAVTGASMWLWFAWPAPTLWWLFNLVAFGGITAAAFLKGATRLLGAVAVLFVVLVALRLVSLVDFDGEPAPILLSAAALTAGSCLFAGSLVMRVVPAIARYNRYVAAAGLTLAAASLHVMGYGIFWRWETPPVWAWMPAEYWIVAAVGWVLAASGVGLARWKRGRSGYGDAFWEAGAVAVMAVLTLAMWLGLMYGVSMWPIFNLALLVGIGALLWYGYRRRELPVAYFAGFLFAVSLVIRCFTALGILAENGLLLWLGPVGLGIGALIFLTGRLRVRWAGTATAELRINSRVWDLAGLSAAIASVYAMSYSEPWAAAAGGTGGTALAFLGEYWFLSGTVWGAALAVLVLIWVVDIKRLAPVHASPGQLNWETSGAAAMGLLALVSWLGLLLGWTWTWLPLNVALLCTVLALVAAGYRWNRADLINLAVIAFAITLFTRYFEFGFGLLGQSLAFIVAGAIMLGMGFGLEFLRRRMLRGVRVVAEPA